MNAKSGKKASSPVLAIPFCIYVQIFGMLALHTESVCIVLSFGFVQVSILELASLGKDDAGAEGLFKMHLKLIVPTACFVMQLVIDYVFAFLLARDMTVFSASYIVLLIVSIIALLSMRKAMEYTIRIDEEKNPSTSSMYPCCLVYKTFKVALLPSVISLPNSGAIIEQLRFSDARSNANIEAVTIKLAGSV